MHNFMRNSLMQVVFGFAIGMDGRSHKSSMIVADAIPPCACAGYP